MENFHFDGVDTVGLAREFGTPLYVMSEDEITRRISSVKSCFDGKYGKCRAHFASKSFLTRDMLRILMREGVGLDIVSGGELYLARDMGFPACDIAFHGNSKSPSEISGGLEYGVGEFVCDSVDEIELIDEIARAASKRASVLIRVNPGIEGPTHRHMLTSGGRTKFGLAPAMALEAVSARGNLGGVSLDGFHFHVGSQLMTPETHLACLDVVLGLIRDARDKSGFETKTLDMGGGFGVAYTKDDHPAPLDDFIAPMVARVEKFCKNNSLARPGLIIEPGRYIAGPSGITLYTVCSVKEIPGVATYAGIDGGYPDNPRPALYEARYDAVVANKPREPGIVKTTIAGKCCESGDIIIRDIMLPEVRRGDVIAVLCTGAYNHSMASNYNKNPIPAVVMIKDGTPRLSARRQSYEDMFARDL
ncbi:MAG: diaminopimelate decarboxylase [Synergistaceae bacterium]|nr:diaminopimelate decarboxylase [Synergistaceae bacterium]